MGLEIFKEVAGYEGLYAISTWGRIKRCSDDLILNPQETSKGYLRIRLSKNGNKKWFKVHRLVAKTFIDNPDNKPQINHKDGNKKNNSFTNLEWVTDEENKAHRNSLLGDMK